MQEILNPPVAPAFTRNNLRNALNWFEIPVRDLARARRFYEALLDKPLRHEDIGAYTLAVFPYDEPGVGGCLISGADTPAPADNGTVVFLDASPSLDAVLARVRRAGGRIVTPRIDLPLGMGCFAHVLDTEGNKVGLHAMD